MEKPWKDFHSIEKPVGMKKTTLALCKVLKT